MLAFALFFVAALSPPIADPLLPAQSGQVQCYAPDPARKTCHALAGYRPTGDGAYVNRAQLPLTPDGAMSLITESTVRVVDGAVCGTVREQDVTSGQVVTAAGTMPSAQAAPLLARIAGAMTAVIGHEVCTHYTPRGDGLVAEISMDGSRHAELDEPVLWVSATDGYRVSQ
jgi:hypothetical protein